MTSTAAILQGGIAKPAESIELGAIERALVTGDLAALTEPERISYYKALCASLELNPLTRPFDYIETNENGKKKLVLYANASCAAQLTAKRALSIRITDREFIAEQVYRVGVEVSDGARFIQASGAVAVMGLEPVKLANALMKAETKATRRGVLKFCGLSLPDESEVDSIPNAKPFNADLMTEPQPGQLEAGDAFEQAVPPDDGWQIPKKTRMTIFDLCAALESFNVAPATWREGMRRLAGVTSRKDLTPESAAKVINGFTKWAEELRRKQ